MSKPLVSVVTPVFNAARFLPETIGSVRKQTFGDWEHVFADDGSTDESPQILRQAAARDDRVKVVAGGNREGPGGTRNRALKAAQARYVAFLDADDLWLPEKLERCLSWMASYNCSFTYHDYRHISPDGTKIGELIAGPETLDWKTLHTRRGFGSCLTIVIDREKIPDFRFPTRERHEDFAAWAQLIREGHTGRRIPEDLARYRRGGRSSNKFHSAIACWRTYRGEPELPFFRAANWWLQYAWNAYWMHRRGAPR